MNLQSKPGVAPELLARFAAIVGDRYAITDKDTQQSYLVEMRDLYRGTTPVVLRPGSVAEVQAILKLANETRTPIVPQGGNTGLVGGQIPFNNEIVMSLTRLDKVREVDAISNTMTCEAGVTLQKAREAAAAKDRLYPQLLPSEGTCTIGGNLATNAGGIAAVQHGIARSHVMGLEVVLADGRLLDNLNKLKKDNTGYDLKNLFIGSEGTLGIITAAVLRLVPKPRSVETAYAGIENPEAALALLKLAEEHASGLITSFEIMGRLGIDAVIEHWPTTRDPLTKPYPWYALIELSSQAENLRETMEGILSAAMEKGIVYDATISESLEQTKGFWFIREAFGEVQRRMGGSIKHDISVPVAAVPEFIARANAAVVKLIPGSRPLPFGHAGDGNVHYNLSQPVGGDRDAFLNRWDEVNAVVFEIVKDLNGSISAEHGVGVMKRDKLPKFKDPVALDLMRSLKRTLDPHNILNPGKVL